MNHSKLARRLPGFIGTGLLVLVTSGWTLWGFGELYYEGWGVPFPPPLRYLAFPGLFLFFTLVAVTWPRIGGWALIVFGGMFSVWWSQIAIGRGWFSLRWVLGSLLPFAGALVLVGVLFLLEGRHRRRRRAEGWTPPSSWLRRNLRYVVAIGFPLLVAVGTSVYYAPFLVTRVDDGERGARLIEGNGVTLVWAPLGPGWNWKQRWGGYPSWNHLALYGAWPVGFGHKPRHTGRDATRSDMEATGLCRYLSEDGTTLMPEPQSIWRMPATDEIVRSLVRRGANAGCTWNGEEGSADCEVQPNKDTPLWAADTDPVYYWSADEYDEEHAWYVPYTGGGRYGGLISWQPKRWGNPRHGYRCVREPDAVRE